MKKMTMPLKHSITVLLLFVLTFSYGFEGELRLLTKSFEHHSLKTWAQENEPLLSGLQRGIDLMRLEEGGELPLVQSADSLSQAHGFLSFDYRIYGVTASYTSDDAQSLLPKILGNMQSRFNVGSSIPFVLMISWFQHQTNQADMLLYVQWDGFTRLIEYDTSRRSLIESLTKDAHSATQAANPFSPQLALASTLSKFRILLTPVLIGYFIVDGKRYTANDTLFTCQCAQAIKLEAFRSNNLPYTKTGKQKWNSTAKYLFDNIGELDRMKASPNSGTVIQADFTDSIGVQYTATLRVYVVDVDFEDAKGRYGFDKNEITQYTASYRKDPNGDFIRWKNIPKTFSDDILVKIKPTAAAHKVYFSTKTGNVTPLKASSGAQTVTVTAGSVTSNELRTHVGNTQGCDFGKMNIWCPDTATIKIKFVVIHEEDDDVQLIPLNRGLPNTTGILPGNNNTIDSQLKPDDQMNGTLIQTGADGILNTTVHPDDIIAPKILKTGNGEMNQMAIGLGANNFLDTDPQKLGGDDRAIFSSGNATGIENGANGKTETNADTSSTRINANSFRGLLGNYTTTTSRVYEKVGIRFTSDLSLDQVAVNYDLDYDGLLEKSSDLEYLEFTRNYNKKRPGNQITKGAKEVFVFIVKGYTGQINASGGQTDGISMRGSHTATIPSNLIGGARTVAHEIGHGIFGLVDNINIPNFSTGVDPDNLMSYDNHTGTELRAFQWLKIQSAVSVLR